MNLVEFDGWMEQHGDTFQSVRYWMDDLREKNPRAFERTRRAWYEILANVPLATAIQATKNMLANEEHHPRRVEQHPGRILRFHLEHSGTRGWTARPDAEAPRCRWCNDTGRVVVPSFGAAYARAVAVYGKARADRQEVLAGCWCEAGHDAGVPMAPEAARPEADLGEAVPQTKVRETLKFIMAYLAGDVTREEYGTRFPLPALTTEPDYSNEPVPF